MVTTFVIVFAVSLAVDVEEERKEPNHDPVDWDVEFGALPEAESTDDDEGDDDMGEFDGAEGPPIVVEEDDAPLVPSLAE